MLRRIVGEASHMIALHSSQTQTGASRAHPQTSLAPAHSKSQCNVVTSLVSQDPWLQERIARPAVTGCFRLSGECGERPSVRARFHVTGPQICSAQSATSFVSLSDIKPTQISVSILRLRPQSSTCGAVQRLLILQPQVAWSWLASGLAGW